MDKVQKYNIDDYLKDDKELSKALIEELLQQLSLYTKTLTEIKEIVSSTLDCGEWIGQGDNKMEQILNKISEVENEPNKQTTL